MEITFAPSFFKSLKRLHMQGTWWYKTYDFFKYDIWRFFKNIWRFRKEMYNFQPWDDHYNLRLFKRSLELTRNCIRDHGHEVDESRLLKVNAMNKAIELLNNYCEDDYLDQAEKELGFELVYGEHWWLPDFDETEEQKQNNGKIYNLSTKLEEDQWKELWEIIHGNYKDKVVRTEDGNSNWDEVYNGTDMRGWWD